MDLRPTDLISQTLFPFSDKQDTRLNHKKFSFSTPRIGERNISSLIHKDMKGLNIRKSFMMKKRSSFTASMQIIANELQSYDLNVKSGVEEIKNILKLNRESRTENHLKILQNSFKQIEFFQQLPKYLDSLNILEIFRELKLQTIEKEKPVFHYGEIGNKFYLILSGKVVVLSPFGKNETHDSSISTKEIIDSKIDLTFHFPKQKILAVLGSGTTFGEVALFHNKPRTASIFTLEKVSFATLTAEFFKKLLRNYFREKNLEKIQIFREIPIFKELSEPELQNFLVYSTEKVYRYKDYIYRVGQVSTNIYFILKGSVEIIREEKNGITKLANPDTQYNNGFLSERTTKPSNSRIEKIAVLGFGQIFGENEAIEGNCRKYDAVSACNDCVLLVIEKDRFTKIFNDPIKFLNLGKIRANWRNLLKIKKNETLTDIVHQQQMEIAKATISVNITNEFSTKRKKYIDALRKKKEMIDSASKIISEIGNQTERTFNFQKENKTQFDQSLIDSLIMKKKPFNKEESRQNHKFFRKCKSLSRQDAEKILTGISLKINKIFPFDEFAREIKNSIQIVRNEGLFTPRTEKEGIKEKTIKEVFLSMNRPEVKDNVYNFIFKKKFE